MQDNNLKTIIFGNKRERMYIEEMTIGGIIIPLIKLKHYKVIMYGCIRDISSIVLFFWNNGCEISAIIDKDEKKTGTKVLGKVPVVSVKEMENYVEKGENTFCVINIADFTGMAQMGIVNLLLSVNITQFYHLNEYDKAQIRAYSYEWCECGRIEYYRKNADRLVQFYNFLQDEESRKILMEYIRVYMECGVYALPQCDGRVKYLYGKKLENNQYEELYKHSEDEVWVNCGANIGDSIFIYFSQNLKAKKVYAFEGDKKIFMNLKMNLEYLPSLYQEKISAMNEFINEETNFDKIMGKEKITLINADIEGNELELVKSMSSRIKKDRPVLALSAYHKAEDLTDLPEYINSIVDDYIFILRKYEASLYSYNRAAELVLYAIPSERKGKDISG